MTERTNSPISWRSDATPSHIGTAKSGPTMGIALWSLPPATAAPGAERTNTGARVVRA